MINKLSKPTILIVDKYFDRGKNVFGSVDDFIIEKAPAGEKLLAEIVIKKKPFGVVVGPEKYSDLLYKTMQKGSILARFGVGHDGVNLEKAHKAGIIVTNTPGILETSVAELTVFL